MSGSEPDTASPTDLRELSEAVAGGGRVLPTGRGTALSWGAPVHEPDTVLRMDGMAEVLVHNPADMTVSAGAGLPLNSLQRTLAGSGQRLSLDPARAEDGATVGGLLATADAGALRHAYGTLASLVLGATVVFADGTVARTGGHVVKNVAGYDLAKLVSGSLGTLAVIGEVVLRLHPRPEHVGTLTVRCPLADGFRYAGLLVRSPLEPVALDWEDGRFAARFEGTAASVTTRLERAAALLPAGSDPAQEVGPTAEPPRLPTVTAPPQLPTVTAPPRIPTAADTQQPPAGETAFRAGTLPSDAAELSQDLHRLADEHGVLARWRSHLLAGVHAVRLSGGDAEAHAAVLRAWRDRVAAAGGGVTLHHRIDGLDRTLPAWGPAPGSAPVLRALKERLDPEHRLSPGRFAPWIDT